MEWMTLIAFDFGEQAFSAPTGTPSSHPKSPPARSEAGVAHEYERTNLLDARCKVCGAKNEKACHKKSASISPASSSESRRSPTPTKHNLLVRKRSQVMPAPEPVPSSSQTSSPTRSVAKKEEPHDSSGQENAAHSVSI